MSNPLVDSDIHDILDGPMTSEPDPIVDSDENSDENTDVDPDFVASDKSGESSEDDVNMDNTAADNSANQGGESEDEDRIEEVTNGTWGIYTGKQKSFLFTGRPQNSFNLPKDAKAIEYFNKYLTNDLLQLMVDETNRNASQVLANLRLNRSSRLRKWKPTNMEEMKHFLGMLLWMGLFSLPRITDYWTRKPLYKNQIACRVMSRNRFQLLMRFWHFNNNANLAEEGRLAKILPLIKLLNGLFDELKTPDEELVIDESMVPFRGRLFFRQYLPNKAHKYGIKIFKICDKNGYTYGAQVYMGKGTGIFDGMSLASSVVIQLMENYLNKGHTLYVDNFYTSIELANILLSRQTHLVGTVVKNRKGLPKPNTTLKKGQMSCLENSDGITYTTWVDKRPVRMLSTKHSVDFVDTGKRTKMGEPILKPLVVLEYNKAKSGIDLSDQMSSYNTALRKTMRWYHKVAEELLLGTAIVNAWLCYKENVSSGQPRYKLFSITQFKEQIVYHLLGIEEIPSVEEVAIHGHHYLSESAEFTGEGKNKRRVRKNCKICYRDCVARSGRLMAKNLKKVTSFCELCPGKPYLCKDCFKNVHK